jgi:hypothetical protein
MAKHARKVQARLQARQRGCEELRRRSRTKSTPNPEKAFRMPGSRKK